MVINLFLFTSDGEEISVEILVSPTPGLDIRFIYKLNNYLINDE